MQEVLIKFKEFEAAMFKEFPMLPMDLRQTLEDIEGYILRNAKDDKLEPTT